MLEQYISEIIKWVLGIILVFVILTTVIIGVQIQDMSRFKQEVNTEIERSGGLNLKARRKLRAYSSKYYQARFSVKALDRGKKDFGTAIHYEITNKIKPIFFVAKSFEVKSNYQAVVQVRG